MFDSLKSKLKGLFKKTPEKLEETVYEARPAPEEPEDAPVRPEVAAGPVPETEAVRAEEPKLSRRDRVKAEKDQRKAPSSPVGDSGKRIKDGVRENLTGKKYSRQYSLDEIVEMAVRDAVHKVLKVNEFDFDAWMKERTRPAVIMFVGINGTGKTTAIAKVANRLQKQDMTVVLAACDTFRAGAIEQLTIHADRLGAKIVKHAQDADPAAVAYDAIEHARSKRRDAVLIDTAGRMQTNSNLIEEMKKVARIAKPDLKVFVGDSLAGNDAIEQAKVFDAAIGIDAIILTKIDTDAKGGAALSIAHTIGRPIAFVCDGQEYEDIQKFSAEWMLNRLFD